MIKNLITVIKNVPANTGDAGDLGSVPKLGRSPGEEMTTHSSIFARIIPWTEKSDGLQSTGLQRTGYD